MNRYNDWAERVARLRALLAATRQPCGSARAVRSKDEAKRELVELLDQLDRAGALEEFGDYVSIVYGGRA